METKTGVLENKTTKMTKAGKPMFTYFIDGVSYNSFEDLGANKGDNIELTFAMSGDYRNAKSVKVLEVSYVEPAQAKSNGITQICVVQENDVGLWEAAVNRKCEELHPFATQTTVVSCTSPSGYELWYTAVLFFNRK